MFNAESKRLWFPVGIREQNFFIYLSVEFEKECRLGKHHQKTALLDFEERIPFLGESQGSYITWEEGLLPRAIGKHGGLWVSLCKNELLESKNQYTRYKTHNSDTAEHQMWLLRSFDLWAEIASKQLAE